MRQIRLRRRPLQPVPRSGASCLVAERRSAGLRKRATICLKTHLTIQAAAEVSGYNAQYMRRLLRAERFEGLKIGQNWLIKLTKLRTRAEIDCFFPKLIADTCPSKMRAYDPEIKRTNSGRLACLNPVL
jgi:hypothetical protein